MNAGSTFNSSSFQIPDQDGDGERRAADLARPDTLHLPVLAARDLAAALGLVEVDWVRRHLLVRRDGLVDHPRRDLGPGVADGEPATVTEAAPAGAAVAVPPAPGPGAAAEVSARSNALHVPPPGVVLASRCPPPDQVSLVNLELVDPHQAQGPETQSPVLWSVRTPSWLRLAFAASSFKEWQSGPHSKTGTSVRPRLSEMRLQRASPPATWPPR